MNSGTFVFRQCACGSQTILTIWHLFFQVNEALNALGAVCESSSRMTKIEGQYLFYLMVMFSYLFILQRMHGLLENQSCSSIVG